MFCSLIPRLFLVKGENKPGYKAKYFVCVMVVGVGLRVTLREKNVVSCRIAASAVSHCEANILPQHISHGVRSLSEWLKEK